MSNLEKFKRLLEDLMWITLILFVPTSLFEKYFKNAMMEVVKERTKNE